MQYDDSQACGNQDTMVTYDEETQDDDFHKNVCVTGGVTVVKETQLVGNDGDDGCHANNTLVYADSRLRELNETAEDGDNDDDDDILLVATENVNKNNVPNSQRKFHHDSSSTSDSVPHSQRNSVRNSSQRSRRPRIKRSRSMRFGKQTKLMNAAVDSRQSSVLDFFGAKNTRGKSEAIAASATDSGACSSTASSTCSSINSTTGQTKPWPLTVQATSKAGNSC